MVLTTFLEAGASSPQHGLQVAQHLLGLGNEVARADESAVGVQGTAPTVNTNRSPGSTTATCA
jgi:hypothetical protein